MLTAERVEELGKRIAGSAGTALLSSADDVRRNREYLAASTWRYAVTLERLDIALRRPLRNATVIDVGAYPGHLAAYLSQEHGARLTAVTLMTSAEFETHMRRAGVAVAVLDAEREPLPAPTGGVDALLCCELIEHLDGDVLHMLREGRRVLREDGAFLLTTPNHASIEHRWALLRGRSVYPPLDLRDYPFYAGAGVRNPMRHVREFTVVEIASLLREAGFTRVSVATASPPLGDTAHLSWRGRVAVRLQHAARRLTSDGGALIVATAQP